jgi:hypothetical protein
MEATPERLQPAVLARSHPRRAGERATRQGPQNMAAASVWRNADDLSSGQWITEFQPFDVNGWVFPMGLGIG